MVVRGALGLPTWASQNLIRKGSKKVLEDLKITCKHEKTPTDVEVFFSLAIGVARNYECRSAKWHRRPLQDR